MGTDFTHLNGCDLLRFRQQGYASSHFISRLRRQTQKFSIVVPSNPFVQGQHHAFGSAGFLSLLLIGFARYIPPSGNDVQDRRAIDNLFARFIATPLLARPGLKVSQLRAHLLDLLIQIRHFILS